MEEMRDIRAAAEAYYKNGDRNTIESAEKFFRDLDHKGDGRVSVAEFMHFLSDENSYNPRMRNRDFFRKIDKDGDGELDFNDVCTFFYIIVSKRQFCEGCGDFLKGLFFTCVKCYDDSKQKSYNLCSSCFGGGNGNSYFHDHKYIIDNYLLHTLRMGSSSRPEPASNWHQVTVAAQGWFPPTELHNREYFFGREREMEEMREIRAAAEAYYKNGDTNAIESARKFFRDLDNKRDGRVSVAEFMHFLRKNSYNPLMRTQAFFRKLDQDSDGELDFNDVFSLLYIIVSKRQFCEGCGDFLEGLFFTCVKCYDDSKQYNLCSSCFGGKWYIHDHKCIIDNYLLHTQRRGFSSLPEPAPNSHQATAAAQVY